MNELTKLILVGLAFAIGTEIYDNFVLNHRPLLILVIVIPIYATFFLISYLLLLKSKISPRLFSVLIGLIGLIFIEDVILGKSSEPWPIQIYMFSYWFSIFSYPLVLSRSARILALPSVIALAASIAAWMITGNALLSLSLLMVIFHISSALGNFIYLKATGSGFRPQKQHHV